MSSLSLRRRIMNRALVALLAVALVFTMMPLGDRSISHAAEGDLQTHTPVLAVTGTGLIGGAYSERSVSLEKSYTLEELKSMKGVRGQIYSARGQKDPWAKTYFIADGVKVSSLIGDPSQITDEVTFRASDGYYCSFLNGAEVDSVTDEYPFGKGTEKKPYLGAGRYSYDNFNADAGTEVPTILSWAYQEKNGVNGEPPTSKPTEVIDGKLLRLITGQVGIEEGGLGPDGANRQLFNGNDTAGVQTVEIGSPIGKTYNKNKPTVTEPLLTVDGKGYTRADVLLMDYAENSYTYKTNKGTFTDVVRGVPMSVLLDKYDKDDVVTFTTVDGFGVNASGYKVRDLIENDYILAYEKGETSDALNGIYEKDKNDSSIWGVFTLYGDDNNPAKMISGITVTKASGIDFSKSEYKHITNGGLTGQEGPYGIDAITGATLTIEGPGTVTSTPLSVKDLENQNAGCYRGVYTDTRNDQETTRTYEGVDLYHILHNMEKGDSGIKLTEDAYKVKIKNRNRQTIAELTLEQIGQMHEDGDPAIVAYGTAYEDGTDPRPFVFDGATGAKKDLGNEDGCLKFIYDKKRYGGNEDYTKFGNMAYIYVEKESTPGFKHDKTPYNTPENSQYVLTVTGDEIGREINYKVSDLENLVQYNTDGTVDTSNGYGWRDEYSLANNSYWYVNRYEGIKLWSLLRHSGIPEAKADDEETKVTFKSTDNYGGFDTFSLKQVADPDSFGFYEKNAADNNDGTYVPNENLRQGNDVTTGDKLGTGYPVLVAYGVNEYPYVINKKLDGYLSGLSNDGGPLRVISGKMNYNHANGSNQAKLLDKIIVGEDTYHYSTHSFNDNEDYTALKDNKLTVTINNGTKSTVKEYTIEDLEKIIYGGELTATQLKEAKIKNYYEVGKNGTHYSDLYEGVNLNYFIKEVIQMQGSQGRITFNPESDAPLELDLEDVLALNNGYNYETKLSGLSPVIAYAKNGYPLVKDKNTAGYVKNGTLFGITDGEKDSAYTVKNDGGPLQVVFPRASANAESTMGSMSDLTSIEIDLEADKYAHASQPYDQLAENELTVSGEGTRLTEAKTFTVEELEGKQSLITTKDYSILKSEGENATQMRYRGLNLYKFLRSTDVGLKNNADKVKIWCSDTAEDQPYVFSLSEISKANYINSVTGAEDLPVILAYGAGIAGADDIKDGLPLVKTKDVADGYNANYGNNGGPLKLVVGQTDLTDTNSSKQLKDVVRIEVTAGEQMSWNHSSQEVFKQYLDQTLNIRVVDNDNKEIDQKALTVSELEAMTDIISQERIDASSSNIWEGLNFWQLIQREFADIDGIGNPTTINVKAKDGYGVDVVEKTGLDALKNGVKDGDNYVPVMLAYAVDGYPLSSGGKNDTPGEGYDSTVDNRGGPLRLMVHNAQGACIMEVTSVTIKVGENTTPDPGTDADFKVSGVENGSFKIADLKKMTQSEKEYTYKGKEGDKARGVYLKDILKEIGVEDTKSVFTIDAGGYAGEGTYVGITLEEAIAQNYMVAYEVYNKETSEWETFEDTSKDDPNLKSKVRIYRDYLENNPDKDQSRWYNKCTAITGITISIPEKMKFTDYPGTGKEGELPLAGIRSTAKDSNGNLWIGTYGGGASFLQKGSDQFITYNKTSEPALNSAVVSAVCPDKNGGIWISQNSSYTDGTANSGVAYMKDGQIKYYRAPDTVPDDYVQEIKIDKNENVWFGSFGGLTKFDPAKNEWTTWDKEDGFPAMSVDNIEFDDNGGIWCGFYPESDATDGSKPFTGGFAYFKDGQVIKSYQIESTKDSKTGQYRLGDVWVRDIAVDENGGAWIIASGSYANMDNVGGTVWRVENPGEEAVKYTGYDLIGKDLLDGATNSELRMAAVDPDGGLWLGTSADGIFHISDPTVVGGKMAVTAQYAAETKAWPQEPNYDNIYSLDFYGSQLIAGSAGGLTICEFEFSTEADTGDSDAENCDIRFTGKGLKRSGYYTIKGLKNIDGVDRVEAAYSWMNSSGSTGSNTFEGAYLDSILSVIGMSNDAYHLKVIASDGYTKEFDLDEINVLDKDGHKMMIAWKSDEDPNNNKINPKLVIGQSSDSNNNKSKWISNVVEVRIDPATEQEKEELRIKKEAALKEIKDYLNTDLYNDEGRADAQTALRDGMINISGAKTLGEIKRTLAEAKAAVDAVAKDESAVRAFAAKTIDKAVEEAKDSLSAVEDEDAKKEAENKIDIAAAAAKAQINEIQNIDNVVPIVAAVAQSINEIAADAVEKAEEKALTDAKNQAIQEVMDHLNENSGNGDQAAMTKAALEAIMAITQAADAETIQKAKTAAKSSIDKVVADKKAADEKAAAAKKAAAQKKAAANAAYNNAVKKAKALKVKKFKVKAKKKKKARVTWAKTKGATGYEIYRATKKKGKYKKVKVIKKASTKRFTNKKLKARKTYYYKMRPYTFIKNPAGKTVKVYGKYTKAKKIRAKR